MESFDGWKERLQKYFIANNIEADKKIVHTTALMGGTKYTEIKNALFPGLPVCKT